jgi:hypothetical protein
MRHIELRHQGLLAVFTAGVFVTCVWGCRVAGNLRTEPSNQNTAASVDNQTSKLEPLIGKNNPDCPAAVKVIKTGPSKPPFTFNHLQVKLMNRQSKPIWLLLRHRDSFPPTGQFACEKLEKHCFSTMQLWDGGSKQQGKVVLITFLGVETFRAIHIPAGGDIILGNYIMTTLGPVTDFEVWEVDSLRVNGKTPLEEWLPYSVISDRVVHIGDRQKQTVLDLDKNTNKKREDYPNEKVEFVTARAIRKWLAPVTASKAKNN